MIVGGGARHIPGNTFQSAGCCCSLADWLAGWRGKAVKAAWLPLFTPHPPPVYGASFPIHLQTLQTDAGQPLWGGHPSRYSRGDAASLQ